MVQLSQLYMTTGKTITLIRLTFVSKVMSLLLNMLFRFFIAFKKQRLESVNVAMKLKDACSLEEKL